MIETIEESDRKLSYCEERLKLLGITQQLNLVRIKEDHYDAITSRAVPVFSENKHGDIEILYVGLNGVHTYSAGRKEKNYTRLRLHPDRCTEGFKYRTPRGAGVHVFFPPVMLDLYKRKTEVKTLVITEGEFKAFKVPCTISRALAYREFTISMKNPAPAIF